MRAKDGKRLKFLFQTSINAPRQKTQAIVKQAAAKAGIEIEMKSVVASVFFSSDAANPDTYPHFYADLQMYNTTMTAPTRSTSCAQFTSWEIASKDNKWQGGTSPAGATRSTTGSGRRPRARWIRSSAPRCSSG